MKFLLRSRIISGVFFRFIKLVFCIFFFLGAVFPSFAKDGKEHTDDMLKVLGLYSVSDFRQTAENRRVMAELTSFINDSLDSRTGENKIFYASLKKRFPLFNYGGSNDYGHRLLYHWGFEYGDPENQAALKIKFDEKYPPETANHSLLWNEFISAVKEEQGKRNMLMRQKTDEFFALGGAREYSRAIAGLLYYTHLLGDHIEHTQNHTKTVEAVLSVQHIVKNLDSYVRDLSAHGSTDGYQNWKKAVKTLDAASFASADRYADVYKKYENAPLVIPSGLIKNYVYFARDRSSVQNHPFLKNGRFEGAQIMYSWVQLEPQKDCYDFTAIREDYEYLASYGKKLFIQLQDATFDPAYKGVPAYLFTDEYGGGAVYHRLEDGSADGWVAKRWNENVQKRFALLLAALAKEFDGKIAGLNLQETAITISEQDDPLFNPSLYVKAIKANMLVMKKAFRQSVTMQYANFMPGEWLPWDDKGYLRSIYAYGQQIGVGLGAPDLMVQKKGQLNHALAMLHEGTFTVPTGIAVQDGNYIGQTNNSEVVSQRKNLVPMLYAFAEDFLRVRYIFWANQKPYFEQDVLPSFSDGL